VKEMPEWGLLCDSLPGEIIHCLETKLRRTPGVMTRNPGNP